MPTGGLGVTVNRTVLVIAGSGVSSLIVQVCVPGSKPGTGTSSSGAVEAGMLKTISSGDMTPSTTDCCGLDGRPQAARTGIIAIGHGMVTSESNCLVSSDSRLGRLF